jgi:Flp pilus assembly protein TadD
MRGLKYLLLGVLLTCNGQAQAQRSGISSDCIQHLEAARLYEVQNDQRAEQEFKLALAGSKKKCRAAFLEYSQSLSRNLRFHEAAMSLQSYIKLAGTKDQAENREEVKLLQEAARLKQRVDDSPTPALDDLLKLTRLAEGYARRKDTDALPYAEKAVKLYPDSVVAILQLVDLIRGPQLQPDRVEQLLNRAIALDQNNARAYSSRGWFYLFTRDRRVDAETDFRQAFLLSNNSYADALKGLGYVLMFNGQKTEAVAVFRRYLILIKGYESYSEVPFLISELKNSSSK